MRLGKTRNRKAADKDEVGHWRNGKGRSDRVSSFYPVCLYT